MRSALLTFLLLVLVTPAAAATEWQRLGTGTVLSDEERWLVLVQAGDYRPYDTRLRRFAPSLPQRPGCALSALGRGRGLLRCPAESAPHLVREFHVVDLATGATRKLRRRGNRTALSLDTITELGRHWAGGLSCDANHRGPCPQVYINLRTHRRVRIADRRRRDLDAPRLRVTRAPVPAELVQTGPPRFDLLLRRPGRDDVVLRSCRDTMECWHAYERADVAFWRSDDATLNAYDARTDVRRTLAPPEGSDPYPVGTATRHALVLTVGGPAAGVYVAAR